MSVSRASRRALLAAVIALVVATLLGRVARAAEPEVITVPARSLPPPASPKLTPGPDLSPFVGRPISKIEISLDDDTWTIPELPKITSVRPGQRMTGDAARRAMSEVLDSGRFAQARVSAVADGERVRIVVHVVQRRIIETLRLDLHGAPIDRDELLREAGLTDGGEVLGVELPTYRRLMETYLARRGFPTASVTLQSRGTDDAARVLLLIDVSPGGARILQRRVFYAIGADSRALAPILEGYRVGVGGRADENALEEADTAMAARLHALGYRRAEVSHDLVFADGLVTLRMRADTGPRFVPRFEGNESYDGTALSAALALDEEGDVAPGHLTQKVKDFYVKRGFLDAEVTLETRGTDRDPIHLLVFHILEHARVKVATRSYPCVKLDEIKHLSGGGPTSPGAVGQEIDSFLDEELPGADLVRDPDPRGLDATITDPRTVRAGTRVVPLDLQPDATFAPDTYDRALLHVQELYRNEGYLHAEVGPVGVVRRACSRRSPAGRCIPVPVPAAPADECTYDTSNLPLPAPPLDRAFTCVPDPARGVECEPEVTLRIPVKLGPRTMLYDLQFSGVRAIPERRAARATALVLGEAANTLKLEDAQRKLVELYKEEGYAYVDVKYTLDTSADHSRARARFDVVEGAQVLVRQIVIRGNVVTNDWAIRRRIALEIGKPYRTSDVRKTQERIATLNVFSNINVGLEDPYVPQRDKAVIVTVTERKPQSIDTTQGVSTGEGIRGELGYSYANIGGDAIGLAVRARLSYLPDALIFDSQVRQNFDSLGNGSQFSGKRLAHRETMTLTLPELGLGPLVRLQIDGVENYELERDFTLEKVAGIPAVYYRPFRELQFVLSQSVEFNNAHLFEGGTIAGYLQTLQNSGESTTDLATLLRIPDGPSFASAQRFVVTWDRRDNSFNPHRGTFFVSGLEHTDWYNECGQGNGDCIVGQGATAGGHTIRFSETLAGYIPVTSRITLAAELRTGVNVQLPGSGSTYPDRLFFLGGVQSVRGYLQDSLLPQEYADRIAGTYNAKTPFNVADVPIRGGDLMINPKVELRIPVVPPFDTVVFMDAGNVWLDPRYIIGKEPGYGRADALNFSLRYTAGTGIRVETPIGPLAFDYGVNLSRFFSAIRRSYEDFGDFHFEIGLF